VLVASLPVEFSKYVGMVVEVVGNEAGQTAASHKIVADCGGAGLTVGMSNAVTQTGVFAVHCPWEGVQVRLKLPPVQGACPGGIGMGVLPPECSVPATMELNVAHGVPELNPVPVIRNDVPPFCAVTVMVGCSVVEQPNSKTAANIGNTRKRFMAYSLLNQDFHCGILSAHHYTPKRFLSRPLFL
jgi:hypothetical protein